MKYFILLTDTSLFYSGGVFCETGIKKLKMYLGDEKFEVEETLEFDCNSYEYVHVNEIGPDPRCGERNVFHDHNGNEWYN